MSRVGEMSRGYSGEFVRGVPVRTLTVRAVGIMALALLLSVLISPTLHAERATPQEMERVCQNWLTYMVSEKGAWAGETSPQITDVREIIENDTVLAYCYSIAPNGYVVVPVLKELPPVKTCSEECSLDVNAEHGFAQLLREVLLDRVRAFTEAYGSLEASQPSKGDVILGRVHGQQWDHFLAAPDEFETSLSRGAYAPMDQAGPLLTTSWHQGSPYYNYCPMGDGGRCVVGCVATAAAQIMAYHQWPTCGYGSHTYYWPGDYSCEGSSPGEWLSADFWDDYDWANMADNCHFPGCTPEEEDALAELCYEVGVAFEMDYGRCGSGIYGSEIPYCMNAYETNFRYRDQMVHEWRLSYNSENWFNLIKTEINESRPIWYFITGHSIVCDGWRDPSGVKQYHMNYGWDDGHTTWYTLDEYHCPSGAGSCSQDHESIVRNIAPDRGVMFVADTTFGWVPFDVNFTGSSEYEPVDSWTWDFGDGGSAFIQSPLHTYEIPGMFDVSLAVDTGGDTLSIERPQYVIGLADSLIACDALGSKSSVVEVTISARNNVPLSRLIIPFEFFGTLNTSYYSDTFSTVGCRTEAFEVQSWFHYDLGNGHGTVKLETSSSALPPGEGAVLKLYFAIPYTATPEQADTVEVDGYSTYLPEFSGNIVEYNPRPVASEITATCCTGIRGNVDGDMLDDVNVADITHLVGYLFKGGPEPPCIDEANVDGIVGLGGPVDVSDVTYLVAYLFLSGPPPPPCL